MSNWGRIMREGKIDRVAMWREGKETRELGEPMRAEGNLH